MNDELETRIRDAFRSGSLPAAPSRLLDHLDEVTSVPLVGASERDSRVGRGRRPWGALAVAAVLLVGGAVAASIGGRGPSPLPNVAPSRMPPEPSVGGPIRLIYEPRPMEVTFADVLPATVEIVQHRIDATGLVGAAVSTDRPGRIIVDLPSMNDPGPIRRLIGQVGRLTFVPLGSTAVEPGTQLDPASYPAPIVPDSVTGASVGAGQDGQPTLSLTLSPLAARTFENYTAANIGSYFALVLDGTVVAAPMINERIPGGQIELSFAQGLMDPARLAELATVIRFGPLPVALVEVVNGSLPTGPSPSASSVAADPPIHCGPRVDVGGLQLECDRAVHAALAFLPAGHPPIRDVTFDHGCPEIPGSLIDCATQMFGIIGITFVDGSPAVRILVDYDLKTSYLPGSVAPGPSDEALQLNLNISDFGCDTVRMAYRSVIIHIDPSAADPVWAVADTGDRLRTFWSPTFHGGTKTDLVVYDGRGVVVAFDGTRIDLPNATFPTLAGYFVCPSADAIYIFDRAG